MSSDEKKSAQIMAERRAGYHVAWWMAVGGFVVGGFVCSAITALAIFGSHLMFCGS